MSSGVPIENLSLAYDSHNIQNSNSVFTFNDIWRYVWAISPYVGYTQNNQQLAQIDRIRCLKYLNLPKQLPEADTLSAISPARGHTVFTPKCKQNNVHLSQLLYN